MRHWKPTDLLDQTKSREGVFARARRPVAACALLAAFALTAGLGAEIHALWLARAGARPWLWPGLLLAAAAAGAWLAALRWVGRQEQKNANARLSRILLDNFLGHFPGLVYFKDRECRFVRISQSHVRHFRLQSEEQAWGKTDLDMFTAEHGQQAMQDEKEIMRTGEPLIDLEEKETWAGGRETWASTSKLPLRDENGEIIGTFGVSLDITRRRQAEEALTRENTERRRAEEEAVRERDLLHALMDNIPDLIYFKDADSRFMRINKAHAAAVGLGGPEEAVGKTDFDFHSPDFARSTRQDEQELMTTGRTVMAQEEHDPRTGRWYLATKVPLKDKAGSGTGLVGISKDITERKLAEEKLDRDLKAFLEVVSAVAQGDLTRRGQEGDDTLGSIARAVNQMLDGFSSIVSSVRDTAFSVSTSATEILAAANQIAKGAKYGSDELHSTTSAVEEMAASMTEVSRSAEQTADAASQALEHVRQGEGAANAAASGMTRIDAAVSEAAEKMRLLERRSQQIFEIIALIQEIASQSNLLSLNASIEAAHAGDAGRGFGVVADEIRHLANRSSEAIKDVTRIVEGIVDETRQVLSAMENGLREVRAGLELSERAQRSLHEIQTLVERSATLTDQIFAASREQALATQTVSQAMQTIANVTQQSSAGANETTKAVKDLVAMAEQVNHAISLFKVDRARVS